MVDELELIYRSYPKKLGKSPGMRTAKRLIKTKHDLGLLKVSVENYKNYLKENHVDAKFIMYWSTFMNQWEDWLDPEQGLVDGHVDKWEQLKRG